MKERYQRVLLWMISVGAVCMFLSYSIKWMSRTTHGFAAYYTYARMMWEGEDFSRVYDYAFFNDKIHAYGMPTIADQPNNIPTNALTLLPFAWLQPQTAKIAWSIISMLLFAMSLKTLFK